MLRVLSAGAGRSGSTWLHNACIALLEQSRPTYGAWCARWDLRAASRADALVMKVHLPEQIGDFAPKIVVTCHRDLRDVALSLRDYQKIEAEEGILEAVAWARGAHEAFAPRADLDLPYERMVADPLGALGALADVLGVREANLHRAREMVEGWEPLPGDARHRFDGRPGRWRDQLSANLLRAIEARHGDWLDRWGYARAGGGSDAKLASP